MRGLGGDIKEPKTSVVGIKHRVVGDLMGPRLGIRILGLGLKKYQVQENVASVVTVLCLRTPVKAENLKLHSEGLRAYEKAEGLLGH